LVPANDFSIRLILFLEGRGHWHPDQDVFKEVKRHRSTWRHLVTLRLMQLYPSAIDVRTKPFPLAGLREQHEVRKTPSWPRSWANFSLL
jgi:hypothetical protein